MGFFFTAKIETGHCIYTRCIRVILKLKKKIKYVLPYSAPFSDKAGTTLTDRVVGGGHMGRGRGVCCICSWITETTISANLSVNSLELPNTIRVYILTTLRSVFKIHAILNRVTIMSEIDTCFMNDYIRIIFFLMISNSSRENPN